MRHRFPLIRLLWLLALVNNLHAAQFDLATASVADINAAFDAGALTSEKLVTLCLARIQAYDQAGPRLNVIITLNPQALATARALDAERKATGRRSPLHGIPVLLKDIYNTADLPTTAGSKALAGNGSSEDAFTVARLRAAGAVILAKVNLSEFARSGTTLSSLLGQTLNPYDLTRTPGGSSGGTGAGIAATFGIVGTGTDTGQSTRSPASANCLVGIRPTFGLISRAGIVPFSYTQDTAGPITRCVADAAVMLDQLVGFDPRDEATWAGVGKAPKTYTTFLDPLGLKGARIGFVKNVLGDGSHPDHALVNAITAQAIDALRAAGATVIPVELPEVAAAYRENNQFSVSSFETKWMLDRYFASLGPKGKYPNLAAYVSAAGEALPAVTETFKRALEKGDAALRDPQFAIHLERQAAFRKTLVEAMDKLDLAALFYPHQRRLVVPIAAGTNQAERNGFLAANTGLPAITVPGGFSPPTPDAPLGVPVGVEFLGRPFSEGDLIRLAYGFEQTTRLRLPPASTPPLPGETFAY